MLQMAGRAGRRGMDEVGHVVLCRSPYEDASEAHSMMLQPPDPISSRYFVSYGCALKLLRLRPLEECREIVQRSFGTFLASAQERKETNQLQELEEALAKSEELLKLFSSTTVEDYMKLDERRTAEVRSQRYLEEQEAQTTAETIESLLPFVATGCVVKLSEGRSAVLLDDASPSVAAAMNGSPAISTVVLLLADCSLLAVQPRHISLLLPEQSVALDAEAITKAVSSLPPAKAWTPLPDGSLALPKTSIAGGWLGQPSASQAAASVAFAAAASLVPNLQPEPPSAAVLKQAARVDWVESQMEAFELHRHPRREEILAAYRTRQDLLSRRGRIFKRQAREEKAILRKKAQVGSRDTWLEKLLEEASSDRKESVTTWEQFLAVCDVLRQYGALQEWNVTGLGELVSELAGDNELWLALVMIEVAEKDELRPHQLAAVLASTLDERMRPSSYVAYSVSDNVLECLRDLSDRAHDLDELQAQRGLTFTVALDGGICGLVEAWAQGEAWASLMSNTSLDPGDVFRVLRRTVELLRQVSLVPFVSENIQRRASLALRAMDRYPLADNSLMGIEEDATVA